MSSASKVTLAVALTFTTASVYLVHWQQNEEKRKLHIGVVADMERQERKKRNKEMFEQSSALAERLKQEQRVSSLPGPCLPEERFYYYDQVENDQGNGGEKILTLMQPSSRKQNTGT